MTYKNRPIPGYEGRRVDAGARMIDLRAVAEDHCAAGGLYWGDQLEIHDPYASRTGIQRLYAGTLTGVQASDRGQTLREDAQDRERTRQPHTRDYLSTIADRDAPGAQGDDLGTIEDRPDVFAFEEQPPQTHAAPLRNTIRKPWHAMWYWTL